MSVVLECAYYLHLIPSDVRSGSKRADALRARQAHRDLIRDALAAVFFLWTNLIANLRPPCLNAGCSEAVVFLVCLGLASQTLPQFPLPI